MKSVPHAVYETQSKLWNCCLFQCDDEGDIRDVVFFCVMPHIADPPRREEEALELFSILEIDSLSVL